MPRDYPESGVLVSWHPRCFHPSVREAAEVHDSSAAGSMGSTGSLRSGTVARMADQTLTLPDGRRLAYATYGAEAGPLALFLSGTMGSRLEAAFADSAGKELGFRFVGVDRPGHGQSDDHRPRRFASFADDVARLADHLGAERFALVGWSGGGAHAAAVASVLGARVSRLVLICPASPLDAKGVQEDRPFSIRLTVGLVKWTVLHMWLLALILRAFVRRQRTRFFERIGRMSSTPGDRNALEMGWFRELLTVSWLEGTRQGGGPIARDVALQLRPWDVAPKDPGCPVDLWFGKLDATTPPSISRFYVGLYKDVRTTILDDEGHLLIANHVDAIVGPLAPSQEVTAPSI